MQNDFLCKKIILKNEVIIYVSKQQYDQRFFLFLFLFFFNTEAKTHNADTSNTLFLVHLHWCIYDLEKHP